MKRISMLVPVFVCVAMAATAEANTLIASENFDGGAVGLISSTVPTLDGGGGDTHAVGALTGWPTSGGTPFSLADNSLGDVGDTTFFAGDTEGIYGVAANEDNQFLGISDSDEFGETVSTWLFDISGATDTLQLRIDMGSMEGSTFAYNAATLLTFSLTIDGGGAQTAFDVVADPLGDGYSYRALDNGTVVVADTNALRVSGDNPVIRLLAEDGTVAGNTFLDKSPASGPGAGTLDTFVTDISGLGSQLELTLTSSIPFEAAAIDNIAITQIPEPATLVLLGLGGLLLWRRRSS